MVLPGEEGNKRQEAVTEVLRRERQKETRGRR
jgi:hypothetical protein